MEAALLACFGDPGRLVYQHAMVMRIQRVWRRYHAHAHETRGAWARVLARLERESLMHLLGYYNVRRELRQEPESWLVASVADLDVIARECDSGMWGRYCG